MKLIQVCSKCGKAYPADLKKIHTDGINSLLGAVYEFETHCLNCNIKFSSFISEIEEIPTTNQDDSDLE